MEELAGLIVLWSAVTCMASLTVLFAWAVYKVIRGTE
jgi:hypothetical protein